MQNICVSPAYIMSEIISIVRSIMVWEFIGQSDCSARLSLHIRNQIYNKIFIILKCAFKKRTLHLYNNIFLTLWSQFYFLQKNFYLTLKINV